METHIELITPPPTIIHVDNGCEGSSSNIFIPAKSDLTITIDTTLQKVIKYADILWNRTFGCIGRQAFNYYCSLLQV